MRWSILTTAFFLSACGGGGDTPSGENKGSGSPTTTPVTLTVTGDRVVDAGDSVGLAAIASDGSALAQVTWTISGADQPLAPHSQAIGFTAQDAGVITWQLDALSAQGKALSTSGEIAVSQGPAPSAVARLTHEAVELGKVSLRVDTLPDKTVDSITWQQTSGPEVDLKYSQGHSIHNDVFFQAPAVTRDTLLAFDAEVSYDDGTSGIDTVWVVVNDTPVDSDAFFPGSDLYPTSLIHAYNPQSPWKQALEECIYTATIARSCEFARLPLLGQQTDTPSTSDIMDRVLVSHDWMGEAFEQFLNSSQAGPDIINLLRATTAVVISYDIRPSFYWSATGAIYLDASNIWLTSAQRDTLNTEPDYRSGFDDELAYRTSWRYVKDGEYYYPQPGLSRANRATRSEQQLEASLTWLLYHELAHANDVFPATRWATLRGSDSPLRYANNHAMISDTLARDYPLISDRLLALAQVSYGGAQSTQTQRDYTAQDIATWFEQDNAVSMYGFYTYREDFATLFERFMMLYRMNAEADVGIFTEETIKNGELLITWAQRNRVNEPFIQPRAAFVVDQVLPAINAGQIQTQMSAPVMLPALASWRDTVAVSTSKEHVKNQTLKGLRVTGEPAFERWLPLPDEKN
ncbi:hypothetical protein HHX48_01375 [Salinimonas sp. HHU 13199]|uniref:Lipoprotein n=1 Tax=Salinimonas profundi TaxID=2729140 RepID=A0ABR8LGP8_9ALTE|nr:hypothetical protein [Salinimonas profundi]MBD3584383.1 hypothetical protein [Salinimonas profundi]